METSSTFRVFRDTASSLVMDADSPYHCIMCGGMLRYDASRCVVTCLQCHIGFSQNLISFIQEKDGEG